MSLTLVLSLLLAVLGMGLIGLIVLLLSRRRGPDAAAG
jgi:hypothetical protein